MKKILLIVITFMSLVINGQTKPIYLDKSQPIEKRVKDLLVRMTVEEKAGQLNQLNGRGFTGPAIDDRGKQEKMQLVREGKVGSFLNVIGVSDTKAIQEVAMQSRMKIPLIFGLDVIHGYKTIFPIPLAEACSWNLPQIEINSSIAAKEAAASGINWTFAPMCDISNDPRWGRVMEGAGEDPYYAALVSGARVKGFQGSLNDNNHILSCVKHFAVYGAAEGGREYNTVDVSRVQLWNKYLPPYKVAIDAGAATLMNAFNIFEGVPSSGNKYLINDVLKKKWAFKGFIVSDWGSFKEMINHGYATDDKDAALKAFKAGSMMDMESKATYRYLPELYIEAKVTMAEIDDAVGRILYYKFKLGLFDNPFAYCDAEKEKTNLFTSENRKIAREAAAGSIVLLKNDKNVLPLSKTAKIALIGFYAISKDDMFDIWVAQGKSTEAVSVFDGLKSMFPNSLSFAKGYNADNTTNDSLLREAQKTASAADVIVVNIGISGKMAGEDRSLGNPQISAGQIQLLKALRETGKPIVALVSSGRPLVLTEAEPLTDAMLQCWILGTEHGNAIADVLCGDVNPSAKTVMSFPYAIGQIPVYYNHFNTGRPTTDDPAGNWYSRYRDLPRDPLYPFGYGLSYSNFSYADLNISSSTIKKTDKLIVTVTVKNNSSVSGDEVVQLYIRDYVASIVRPVKELKGFQKIKLQGGDSQTVTFTLTAKDLSFFDANGNILLEAGKFSVFVGGNSRDLLQADFEMK